MTSSETFIISFPKQNLALEMEILKGGGASYGGQIKAK